MHLLPGDHLDWARRPHVAWFARTLSAYLEPAPAASPGRASTPPPAPIPNREALPPRFGRILSAVERSALELAALLERGP